MRVGGAVVALTFPSSTGEPARLSLSKAVGPYFGLTPKTYQSGEADFPGAISKIGDALVRGFRHATPPNDPDPDHELRYAQALGA